MLYLDFEVYCMYVSFILLNPWILSEIDSHDFNFLKAPSFHLSGQPALLEMKTKDTAFYVEGGILTNDQKVEF